jgi:hypothetical protein
MAPKINSLANAQGVANIDDKCQGYPRVLKVTVKMLEAIEEPFRPMVDKVPKVQCTVPIQDEARDDIFEAIVQKSLMENLPDFSMHETAAEINATHENINHRYLRKMHEDLKDQVRKNPQLR